MTALRRSVISSVEQLVQIVYLDRSTSKWWTQRRKPDDTATFCGWYWIHGRDEMGPFRSRSACLRDAYYRFVLKRELPTVGHSQLHGVEKVKPRAVSVSIGVEPPAAITAGYTVKRARRRA